MTLRQSPTTLAITLPPETNDRRDRFLSYILPKTPHDAHQLKTSLIPWLFYLENQLQDGPCASNVREFMALLGIPDPGSAASVYDLLHDVVEVIQKPKRRSISIAQIITLVSERRGHAILDGNVPPAAHQAIFCIIGCLTLLFCWNNPASPDEFSIKNAAEITQVRAKAAQRGFGKVLRNFGRQFVQPEPAEGLLVCANLDYSTLSAVTKLQLEFVSDISLHLLFNPVTRKLCIFSFPAFCALWCNPASDWTYLDGIIGDLYDKNSTEILRLQFQEILLSLRVLFAYNSESRKLFFKSYYSQSDIHLEDREFWKSLLAKPKSKRLASLPAYYWPPPATNSQGSLLDQPDFDRSCDFIALGDRLEHLQHYCMKHNPQKLRDMWYDRRNRQQWVTFWAAIIIGATSIVLSLVQVILAGIQIKSSI
ncbi:hypothetical protein V8C43DRAFT_323524 [Trichoderma afarasin]